MAINFLRIDAKARVEQCQHQFESLLHKMLSSKVLHQFGHLGLSYREEVLTEGDLWYFGQLAGEPTPNRYWNALGLLLAPQPSNIVVEINFPIQGINRRVSGVFAQDSESRTIAILHRGSIGGGRKGIGKNSFLAWYRHRFPHRLVEFDDQLQKPANAILVAYLENSSFPHELRNFVREVYNFKEDVSSLQ